MIRMKKYRLRLKQVHALIKMSLAWLVSRILREPDLWLISERGTEARDNAFFFFVWLKENHPEINAKYIISKSSKDLHKLQKWPGDLVYFNTFNHWVNIWKAKYLISTHICGYTPDHYFFSRIDKCFNIFKNKKKVFLQHGILWFVIEGLFCKNNHLDLFICGSRKEYEVTKKQYGYPNGIVQYTGLCRFDNLHNIETKKQILVMPTWRIYIDRERFEESEYFNAYKELLCSPTLTNILEKYGYNLIFYPHFEFQSKTSLFKRLSLSERVIIADMNYDVQTLLKESEFLITDFSSIYFDMVYMNKPVIFYQFDQEKVNKGHYKKALETRYIDTNKIGPIVLSHKDLLDKIEYTIVYKDKILLENKDYYEQIFELKDTQNNNRVFEAIMNC